MKSGYGHIEAVYCRDCDVVMILKLTIEEHAGHDTFSGKVVIDSFGW